MVRLYCITNRLNGKMYVGITGDSVENRWQAHVKKSAHPRVKFHYAIAQYGPGEFDIVELHDYASWPLAKEAEAYVIAVLDLTSAGYNTSAGGDANPMHSEETRRKQSASHTGKKQSPETCAKRSAALKGRARPQEVKDRIRAALLGREFTPEWRAKMSIAALNRSPAIRANMSAAQLIRRRSSEGMTTHV